MYCGKCGSEIADGATFCMNCGAPAPGAQRIETMESGKAPKRGNGRKRVVGIAVAAVLVIAAAGGGTAWYLHDQDVKQKAAEQAAWEEDHKPHSVVLAINAPGHDEESTPIVVLVEGTDLDGAQVSETHYLASVEQDLQLVQGEYDLSFPGGYFTASGNVMTAPETKVHVEIGEDDGVDNSMAVSSDAPVEFAEVPALDVSDELLDTVTELAAADPNDVGKAEQLRSKAAEIHEQAVEKKRAEEEAARKAEEERQAAERAAALHVETSLYSFDLPEELYGKVDIRYEGGTDGAVSVYSTELGQSASTPILQTRKVVKDSKTGEFEGVPPAAYSELGNFGQSYTIVYRVRDETSIAASANSDKDEWRRLHNACVESARGSLQIFRPNNAA